MVEEASKLQKATESYLAQNSPQWDVRQAETSELSELLVARWRDNNPHIGGESFQLLRNEKTWAEQLQFYLLNTSSDSSSYIENYFIDAFQRAWNEVNPTMAFGNTWFLDVLALRRCTHVRQRDTWDLIRTAIVRSCEFFPKPDSRSLTGLSECYLEASYALSAEIDARTIIKSDFRADSNSFPWGTPSIFRDVLLETSIQDDETELFVSEIKSTSDQLFVALSRIFQNSPNGDGQGRWSLEHLNRWYLLFDKPLLLICCGVSSQSESACNFLKFITQEYQNAPTYSLIRNTGWYPRIGAIYNAVPDSLTSLQNAKGVEIEKLASLEEIGESSDFRELENLLSMSY